MPGYSDAVWTLGQKEHLNRQSEFWEETFGGRLRDLDRVCWDVAGMFGRTLD